MRYPMKTLNQAIEDLGQTLAKKPLDAPGSTNTPGASITNWKSQSCGGTSLQKREGRQIRLSKSGTISKIGQQVAKTPQNLTGRQHGPTVSLKVGDLQIDHTVSLAARDRPMIPFFDLQNWRWLLVENVIDPTTGNMKWAPPKDCPSSIYDVARSYAQCEAVLDSHNRDMVIAALAQLAMVKSYQDKGESGNAIAWGLLADDLLDEGYSWPVIFEGCKLYRKSSEIFFPIFSQLRDIIHPIHYRLCRNRDKLKVALEFSMFDELKK